MFLTMNLQEDLLSEICIIDEQDLYGDDIAIKERLFREFLQLRNHIEIDGAYNIICDRILAEPCEHVAGSVSCIDVCKIPGQSGNHKVGLPNCATCGTGTPRNQKAMEAIRNAKTIPG